jgi:integrase
MNFQVICQKTAAQRTLARTRWSSRAHWPRSRAGLTVTWIASMFAAWPTPACASTPTTCSHFVRWWESIHRTGDITPTRTLPSRPCSTTCAIQSSLQPRPSAASINERVADADRALRNAFPDAPCQVAHGFQQTFLQRKPMGLGRPRVAISRLRVRQPRLNIVPLSVDEVARFWASFHTARDLAIVGLMLMHGLRSAEVLALNPEDVLLSEAQLRVRGKGNKLRFLPLAPETTQLIDHYLRLERPNPCSQALFVVLKGPAHGTRMTPAGLRSLFRYHRQTTGIQLANPHRFRHTFASDMVRAGMSLPALMKLMGHADIETTLRYVQVTPQDVYLQYARAVAQCIRPLPGNPS